MLSQVVINQGNFALQNRAENVVQTVVHCFSITSTNKLKINKITPLSQSPLGSPKEKASPTKYRFCRTFFIILYGESGYTESSCRTTVAPSTADEPVSITLPCIV